jgi:hypothetical protein
MFNTLDFWKNIGVVGGLRTQAIAPFLKKYGMNYSGLTKGEPGQLVASHTAQSAAATILNQAVINPSKHGRQG